MSSTKPLSESGSIGEGVEQPCPGRGVIDRDRDGPTAGALDDQRLALTQGDAEPAAPADPETPAAEVAQWVNLADVGAHDLIERNADAWPAEHRSDGQAVAVDAHDE